MDEDEFSILAQNVSLKIGLGLAIRISNGEAPEQALATEVEDTAIRMKANKTPSSIIEEFREQYRLHGKKLIEETVLAYQKARAEKAILSRTPKSTRKMPEHQSKR